MTPLALEAAANARGKSFLPESIKRFLPEPTLGGGLHYVKPSGSDVWIDSDLTEALIIAGAAKDLSKQGVAVFKHPRFGWCSKYIPTNKALFGIPDATTYEQAVALAAERRLEGEKERSGK